MIKRWYKKLVLVAVTAIFIETLLILLAGFTTDSRWQITRRVTTTNLLLADKFLRIKSNQQQCDEMLASNDALDKSIDKICDRITRKKIRIDTTAEKPLEAFYKDLWKKQEKAAEEKSRAVSVQVASAEKETSAEKTGEEKTLFLSTYGVGEQTTEKKTETRQKNPNVIRIIRRKPSQGSASSVTNLGSGGPSAKKQDKKVGFTYCVTKGDSLWQLSRRYDVTIHNLINYNNLNDESIRIGQKLWIPGKQKTNDFRWPIKGRISSGYGYRINPISKTREFHSAIDIAAPKGRPISAAMSGKVNYAGWIRGYGNTVKINHRGGYSTLYAHMDSLNVKSGQKVSQGQTIGRVGTTGYSTGPHVHFEIKLNGRQINPLKHLP